MLICARSVANMFWWTCLVLAALVAGFLVWRQWYETYHLATVDHGRLYRDGNRTLREFSNMLRRVRPRTVVSLVDDAELADHTKPQFAAENALLPARGVELIRVPVPLGGWPDAAAIEQFLSIAADPSRQPVLVHCAQGVRRTGMMVAAYQMSLMGWSKQQAKGAMLTFGHSQRTVGDVQRFIDVYDPETRRMAASLEMSQE